MSRSVSLGVHAALAAGMVLSIVGSVASAASISYGNLGPVPPGVSFVDITESSGTDAVPLYGAPSAFATGLAFTPTPAFAAQSNLGGGDLTDGQINYTVVAPGGVKQVDFAEGGVYSLIGAGTAATQTFAAASLRAIVTEINGISVAPINLTPSLGSTAFNLVANAGANQSWQIALTVNVASQLAGLGYTPNDLPTRVDVVIDNQLGAISELTSQASISKTTFGITTGGIPEPNSLALAGLALCGLAVGRFRRAC